MGFAPPKRPYSLCPPYTTQRKPQFTFSKPSTWSDRTNLIGASIVLLGLYLAVVIWWTG